MVGLPVSLCGEYMKLTKFPKELTWINSPKEWKLFQPNSIEIIAGEKTDWFVDPSGNYNKDSAPCLSFKTESEYVIVSTKVIVYFENMFDAGTIQIRANEENWAKLCFEYSPQKKPMIVSVITRKVSDDCNSTIIDGNEIYLRVYVNPKTMAFHYSGDGTYWQLVRYFSIEREKEVTIGFSAQSPSGESCRVVFSEIQYKEEEIKNLRSGE